MGTTFKGVKVIIMQDLQPQDPSETGTDPRRSKTGPAVCQVQIGICLKPFWTTSRIVGN